MKSSKSENLYNLALELMPGGVNSPVRSFSGVGGTPPFLSKGNGAYVTDVDGNEYLDFLGSWGPLILGHAHPSILSALQNAVSDGTSFGAPTEGEVELASMIKSSMPSMEMLRLVSSGTEATMSAIRVARAYTSRDKIIKFNGCYHGHVDSLLVKAGSGATTHGAPTSSGVPISHAKDTCVAEFNDIGTVEAIFHQYPNQIAAVIIEPIAGNMGVVPPANGFLEDLKALTKQHDTLLIFDEVITGFRVANGGAQSLYNIHPDLTCFGKIIGGGLPVGAYGGREEIMRMVSPLGSTYQAGTLSGNPLAVSAGIACLQVLKDQSVYANLEHLGALLEGGITEASKQSGVGITVNRVGSMLTAFFVDSPVTSWDQVAKSDAGLYANFFHGMLKRGIYLAPSQFEATFVSSVHTESDIQSTRDTAIEVLKEIA